MTEIGPGPYSSDLYWPRENVNDVKNRGRAESGSKDRLGRLRANQGSADADRATGGVL